MKEFKAAADKFGKENDSVASEFQKFAEALQTAIKNEGDKLKRWDVLLDMKTLKKLKKAAGGFLGAVIGFKSKAEAFVASARAFKNECTDAKLLDRFKEVAKSFCEAGDKFGNKENGVGMALYTLANRMVQARVIDGKAYDIASDFQEKGAAFADAAEKFYEEASKIDSSDKGICEMVTKCIEKIFGENCDCKCCKDPEKCCEGNTETCNCECIKNDVCKSLTCAVKHATCCICKQINSACTGLKGGIGTACGKICEWIKSAQEKIKNILVCTNDQCQPCETGTGCSSSASSTACNGQCSNGTNCLQCAVRNAACCICTKITQAATALTGGVKEACKCICTCLDNIQKNIDKLFKCDTCQCCQQDATNCGACQNTETTCSETCKCTSNNCLCLKCAVMTAFCCMCCAIDNTLNCIKTSVEELCTCLCNCIDRVYCIIGIIQENIAALACVMVCSSSGNSGSHQTACTTICRYSEAIIETFKTIVISIILLCRCTGNCQCTCCKDTSKCCADGTIQCTCKDSESQCKCVKCAIIQACCTICQTIELSRNTLKEGVQGACAKICTWIGKAQGKINELFKSSDSCPCPCCQNPDQVCANGKKCKDTYLDSKGLKCVVVTTACEIIYIRIDTLHDKIIDCQ